MCCPFQTAIECASIARKSISNEKSKLGGQIEERFLAQKFFHAVPYGRPEQHQHEDKTEKRKAQIPALAQRFSWVEITASRTARRVFCVSSRLASQSGQAIERSRHLRGFHPGPLLRVTFIVLLPRSAASAAQCEASVQRARDKAATLRWRAGNA